MTLATTIADHRGTLRRPIAQVLPRLMRHFDGMAVAATTGTPEDIVAALKGQGAVVDVDPPNTSLIGRHRRRAVELALEGEAGAVLYTDIDHVLRWYELKPEELEQVVSVAEEWDCTVVGRAVSSFQRLPRRLRDTEAIVNHVFSLVTGKPWDVMSGVRMLSRPAAVAIVAGCQEDSIGNDVAWPLFLAREGFSLGYVEAEGLVYQTLEQYASGAADDPFDEDATHWIARMDLTLRQLRAMQPYIASG